jgi:hypothetical protein
MRLLRSALVLLATFALSSSFAVPTEDLSETLYDESDALPYEITRPLSGDLVQESVQALQVVPIVPSRLFSPLRRGLDGAGCRELRSHHASGSLVILDHTLRC